MVNQATTTPEIIIREISYTDSKGQSLIGYLAYPEGENKLPAVLVCPEWWGRNDYIEKRARELAEHGYAAFAIDMYGDKKIAEDAKTANAYMSATFDEPDTIVDRATAALNTLSAQPEVNAAKIAAIGFCYGGKVALDLARSGANIQAVATFHANLSTQTPAQTGHFNAEVLVSHGHDDSMVSLDDVEQFKQELDHAEVNYRVDIYPNAKHGFTNPAANENARKNGVDLGYNPLAEAESFDRMYALLDRILK
ncbi:dienelactone hydrolase family protein [Acinetobacter puyangensis]|uniref:dienelactone hydrolase family protein n=1 Tax=Acinetobacter puyangensis TaxID=1096779 RepID=UPI003A4E0746